MVRKLSVARAHVRAPSSSLILCERGDRPLLLPSLSQPRQPARAMGSSHEAASASGCDRSLPSPWPRHSLDRALVRTSWSSHGEGEAGLYRKETDRRRRHRYSKNSPNRRLPIDYLDQMSVNYRDHSQFPSPEDPDISLTARPEVPNRIVFGATPQARRFVALRPKHGLGRDTQRGPPCYGGPQPCFGSRTSARVAPQESPILSPAGMDYRSGKARVKRGLSSVSRRWRGTP